ncbi:MAG TPA: HepT-like ribonuclease domain-containing protein [Acetobacteraceae bacterium]|nr:HepT-like ribonuclease domain-containing protein [Acetobacteraceae bacterium]
MPQPSPTARLTDIVDAIEIIRSEMAGVTLAAFETDRRKRWLVERGIEIISEASRRQGGEGRHAGDTTARQLKDFETTDEHG